MTTEQQKDKWAELSQKYGFHLPNQEAQGVWVIDGNVGLKERGLTELPFKGLGPYRVTGDFSCAHNQLTSLEGAPQEVGGSFDCYRNQLTTLKGGPQEVRGDFRCAYNQLTSLEGGPREVGGDFWCFDNQLVSLEGAPQEVRGNFDCSSNQLTTLKGGPQEVGSNFNCKDNQLTTLEGGPQEVGGDFYCSSNALMNLDGAPQEVGRAFHCENNPLLSLGTISDSVKSRLQGVSQLVSKSQVNPEMYDAWCKDGSLPYSKYPTVQERQDTYFQKVLLWNVSKGIVPEGVSLCVRLRDTKLVGQTFKELAKKNPRGAGKLWASGVPGVREMFDGLKPEQQRVIRKEASQRAEKAPKNPSVLGMDL